MIFPKELHHDIIWTIAEQKHINIIALHESLQHKHNISLKNFYKVVNQFLDLHILNKEKKLLSLNMRRIEELETLVTISKATAETKQSQYLLAPWQHKHYHAQSIHLIDSIWWDILMSFNDFYAKQEPVYIYYSHAHYMIGQEQSETQFRKHWHLVPDQAKTTFFIWNQSYLDLCGIERYRDIWANIFSYHDHPFLREGYYFNVIGDYIIEFIHPKMCSDYFQVFFDSVEHIEKLNLEIFQNIFHMRQPCALRVSHNPQQAEQMKKTIQHLRNKEQSRKKTKNL
jgi:hypothetical protein